MLLSFLKKSAMAAFAVCLFLAGPGPFAARAASGPAEAVRMLQQGIDAKDLALVEKHLDIDGVVANGLKQALVDQDLVAEVAKNPAIAIALALGGSPAANEALQTLLVAEARSYVSYGVASGAFAGKPAKDAEPYRGIFGKAFRGGEKDKKTFGPVKVSRGARAGSAVATTLVDGPKGGEKSRAYPLTLRLERQVDVWRVVEVLNAAECLRAAKEKGQQ